MGSDSIPSDAVIGLNRTPVPTRCFTNQAEAEAWLRQHLRAAA